MMSLMFWSLQFLAVMDVEGLEQFADSGGSETFVHTREVVPFEQL